jgi:outer membrane protein assembly factor BamB
LTGFDKEKKEFQVFCIERNSGNIRWSRIVPAEQIEKVHSVSNPAAQTPAADGERIYVYFGSCGLLCYDFEGKQQWTVPLPMPKTTDGHATSPIVSGELVILNRDEQNDPHLLAVDRHTGKTVWKQPQPSASQFGATSHSTPVVWAEQLVIHRSGEIVAYAATDGTRIWSLSAVTRGTSTPVFGKDALFVAAWTNLGEPDLRVELPNFLMLVKQYDKDGNLQISKSEFPDDLAVARRPEVGDQPGANVYVKPFFQMVDANSDGLINETEWKENTALVSSFCKDHGLIAIKSRGSGDITATHVLWQEKKHVAEVPSPLYYQGRVYMVKNGGLVSCMNAESGKLLYRERLGAFGPYYSSPIVAHGRIYIASGKGTVTVFAAGDTLEVLARNNLKEQVFATPAVVDNKLYVRTAKHMYAFGE